MSELPTQDICWHQWPSDVPRPTAEEYIAAEERRDKALTHSLSYDMACVNRLLWWPYFFPESKEQCMHDMWASITGKPITLK